MSALYVTAKRLSAIELSLTPRERQVLATLATVRLATGSQLQRLHFRRVSQRQTRATLASLVLRRLLARLPRVVGGARAGSAGFVYALDVAGQRLVSAGGGRPQRPWATGMTFLAHSLAVTELYVRLASVERPKEIRLSYFETEPACWRPFPGPGGGRIVLKPDAYLTVGLGGFEDHWFVEVDRGSESTTTISRKCETYRRYWASGREQATAGVFPRVLWVAPDQRRCQQLGEVVRRQPADAQRLFSVSVFDEVVARIAQGADA